MQGSIPERPFALSVMTTFNHSGKQPITDITRIVYEAFALLARSNEWGAALRPPSRGSLRPYIQRARCAQADPPHGAGLWPTKPGSNRRRSTSSL